MISASLRILLLSAVATAALCSSALAQTAPSAAPPAQTSPAAEPATPAPAQDADPEAVTPADGEPGEQEAAAPEAEPITPIPSVWSPVPRDEEGRSAYGLYLAGRVAIMRGEGEAGAALVAAAAALVPEQPSVRDRAFTANLLSGDLDDAARLAPPADEATATLSQAGLVVRAVQDMVHGRARQANAALASTPVQAPHARAGLMIAPWIAAEAGDWTRALVQPPAEADGVTAMFARQNRALLLESRGRFDEAEAEFKTLTGFAQSGMLFRLPYGEFLERRGRRDEAITVYDAAITGGLADAAIRQARARAAAGGRPPALPTYRAGASAGLISAAALAASERAPEFAAFYLRLALQLTPDDQTRFRLAQALGRARLNRASRQELERISRSDPKLYAAAQLQLALSLDDADQPEEALAALRRAAAAAPEETTVARVLAGQLNQEGLHEEALTILNSPLLNTPDQTYDVHFVRGAAYESLGRIDEAEAELWAALQKKPDDPPTLNYLGYLWVDSGKRVEQGAEMVARAFHAQPDNGNIQDSLGWAQYRQGQYEDAVLTLEGAIAKLPANPEINDHLGDAYWQVGRQREARFQWARVLTLDPTDEQAERARRKLEQGLEPVGAQP